MPLMLQIRVDATLTWTCRKLNLLKGSGMKYIRHFAVLGLLLTSSPVFSAVPTTGVPAYDASIRSAIGYLKQEILNSQSTIHGGYLSFTAYALLQAGEPVTSAPVQKAIDEVRKRITSEGYRPDNQEHHIYDAGVDAMLLAEAGGDSYYAELKAISDYIIAQQGADGSWDYPKRTVGDTSMAQYGALGLWAATRGSVDVPKEVWDKLAVWHLRTQQADGGFMYHPGVSVAASVGGSQPTLNMTAGATGTLAICRMHLYPEFVPGEKYEGDKGPKKAFGLLEAKLPDDDPSNYKPQASLTAINTSIGRGLGWLAGRYQPVSDLVNKIYFCYALERTCAMNRITNLGGNIDWYRRSGDTLVKLQKPDGSWDAFVKHAPTAFAILFYLRPTEKAVAAQYGGGLLAGGRGLPSDLAGADISANGIKEKRKIEGPLDELLTELSGLNPDSLADAQAAIVEKVQLGSREELLGELDRIRSLITHPNPELRRTAVWALGRSGDLKDANLLINALNDFNVDVLVETYNSLSYLSRKIDGVGMSQNPFEQLGEEPTQAEKDAALAAWKKEAIARWSAWYLRIRPYADRNDIFELGLGKKR